MFRLLKPRLSISSINKRTFYDPPKIRLEEEEWMFLKLFKKLQMISKTVKEGLEKHAEEIRNMPEIHRQFSQLNQEEVVWKFDGTEKSLDQWVVNCDHDWNYGYSTAKLELSSSGSGIFHGILDTRVTKDGQTTDAGYCNITSTPKFASHTGRTWHDWSYYNELILRVRGDGRCYLINLLCGKYVNTLWYDAYNYIMHTRGGPYWQVVRIPFSKFLFTKKAQVYEIQPPLGTVHINNLGITIADKKPGPFRLEIDHISVCLNPTIFETSAYEMYKVPRGFLRPVYHS